MKQIGIIGHFYNDKYISNGQIIRTQTIYKTLLKKYRKSNMMRLDTLNIKKRPIYFIFKVLQIFLKCENIIIISTYTGLKKIMKIYNCLFNLFKRRLIYIAIGSSITNVTNIDKIKILRNIYMIFVQTSGIKSKLELLNIRNVEVLYNYRLGDNNSDIGYEISDNKVCTFSRVSKDKGISYAIEAIGLLNKKYSKNIQLDVYGVIENEYIKEFSELLEKYKYVNYKGLVNEELICKVLSNYLLVLFPSTYSGEGFPGTILDSLRCGVPVVAMDWLYNSEIIKDNFNGHIVPLNNMEEFINKILLHIDNIEFNKKMRKNCIEDSKKYSEENVFPILMQSIK